MGRKRKIQGDVEAVGFGLACVLCFVGLVVLCLVTYDGSLFPWPNIGGLAVLVSMIVMTRGIK